MRDLMECGTCEDSHLAGAEAEDAGAVCHRIDEHGDGSEYHHCGDCHSRFEGLGLDGGFGSENSGGSTDTATDGSKQRRLAVHLEQFADADTAEDGYRHHYGVDEHACRTHSDNIGESEAEAVENDAQAQYFLGTELYAGNPGFGKMVAEAVSINHTQHDTYNHGAD